MVTKLLKEFLEKSLLITKVPGTCAVVFSSHTLLGEGSGKFIDSHDYVLRFNFAPTRGFEEDVGRKTTHRILGGSSGENYNFKENSEMILRPMKNIIYDKRYLENDYENSKIKENQDFFSNYAILPPAYCSPLSNPSNGFVGINFALHTFDKITLFGFEEKQAKNYHYFDDKDNIEYVKNVMKSYALSNPFERIVSSATSSHILKSHPIKEEKKYITETLNKQKSLHIYHKKGA